METVQDTWSIVESAFDVRYNRHYEGLMAIGSGPLQQRAALEEGLSDDPQDREYLRVMQNVTAEVFPAFKSRVGTFLPGVTGPHPTCGDELINLPALHGLVLFAGNERLDMERGRITGYERRLDLRTGRLRRRFTWHTRRGTTLAVEFERFISARRKHLMALRCRVRHLEGPPLELRVLATLDADVRTNGYDHFRQVEFTGEHEPITVEVLTNGGDRVAGAALLACEPGIVLNIELEPRWAGISGLHVLDSGSEFTVCKYAALTSSRHVPGSPLDAARNIVWHAVADGYERLAAESDAVWRQRWEASDVVIEGDPVSQLGLRVSLYHLLRAVVEEDPRVAIDPKGAAGEAYCGRYFWDTDIFMLPFFLYTRPAVGRCLAAYRMESLPGARRNAQRYGYPGARYAWESSPPGDEHCPNWQYADHEVHVTADAAYGLWHAHLTAPEDTCYLAGVTEVLTETARYWAERVLFNPDLGQYEMLMVMGPDEYTPFSRNNAYTNYLVACTLRLVRTAWEELDRRDPPAANRLRDRLGLDAGELERFADIAERLRIPRDPQRRLVLQSDDFFTLEPFDFDRWWPDRSQLVARCVSQERLYRSQILKQADVVQLMALFPQAFDAQEMQTAYDTYAPLTSHDSSLSRSIHALLAARIGAEQEALNMWDTAIRLDLVPPAAAEGVHAACCAGNWQAAVLGFGGLWTRMQSDVLRLEPHLPQRWHSLAFPLVWAGQPLHVRITHEGTTMTHRGTVPLEAVVQGWSATLEPGREHTFPPQG